MIFTINPEKSLIEISKNNLSNSELEILTEVSKKFPNYQIKLFNSSIKDGGGNDNCGCGGKCNGKLHQLLNKEIFHLKSRVLTLEIKNWPSSSYPTYPYQYDPTYHIPATYCTTADVTSINDNNHRTTGYIEKVNKDNSTKTSSSSSNLYVNTKFI